MNDSDLTLVGAGRNQVRSNRLVSWAFVVCMATWLGSEVGLGLRFPETGAAIIYPPYAVLAAALLLTPPRVWWVFLLASLVGHMLPDLVRGGGRPVAFMASGELANAVRALSAATVWRLLRPDRPRLDTLEDTAIFVGVSGVVAPAAGAFVGAAVVVLQGRAPGPGSYWQVWTSWFLSNAIVGVTLLPMVLVAATRPWIRPRIERARAMEIAFVSVALVATTGLALIEGMPYLSTIAARLGAPLPFLLWVATRFGVGATSASLLVVTASAIVGVMNSWGPFAQTPTDDSVLSLYSFLALMSVPCLLLAALVRERERALAALSEGEQRYRQATSAGVVGVWDWQLDTGDLYVDPVLKHALGYSDTEIPNRIDDWTRHVYPDDNERGMAEARACAEGRSPTFSIEYRMVHRTGSIRWFLVRGMAVREGGVKPTRMVGTTTDITERKEAELELLVQRRELAHLGRVATVGQLSGALAHELRQPLTAILTNAQTAQKMLSQDRPDLAEVRSILRDIELDDMRAGEVITRLRGLLKKGEAAQEQLELSDVVQSGLDIAHADLIARSIAVNLELDPTLPPVQGDRVELQQVLVNLVMNACDAMGDLAPADRRLTVGTRADDAGFVVAYVADRGLGIKEPELDRIFEPFVTSKREGLGLGLSICRTIVQAHRGRLWAANNPDHGATFYLALPASQDSPASAPPPA